MSTGGFNGRYVAIGETQSTFGLQFLVNLLQFLLALPRLIESPGYLGFTLIELLLFVAQLILFVTRQFRPLRLYLRPIFIRQGLAQAIIQRGEFVIDGDFLLSQLFFPGMDLL